MIVGDRKIKTKPYILAIAMLCLHVSMTRAPVHAGTAPIPEYNVKAAFLYNCIKFVDWPESKVGEPNDVIIIGIVGKNVFGDAFDPIKDTRVKDKTIVIRVFGGFEELSKKSDKSDEAARRMAEDLKRCHVLFASRFEKDRYSQIIEAVGDCNILTVGEAEGFADAGGIINFIAGSEKLAFEINLVAAKKAGLRVSSQLSRLAQRVIAEANLGEKRKD